ncbi:MAG: Glu-tRNA(Gln) amidotransferase subunit GatE [Nitrososphaerales archaeon]
MEHKQKALDPYELGLRVGFEIHQQLATKSKLFCNCACVEVEDYESEFVRRLRPTQSELGEYDPAALFEFRKGRLIKYLRSNGSSCLVEADEEPPHDVNNEALDTSLIISLALKSNIVDEVHVMRKIVIDGSNTTGFQRTALVAMGGSIDVDSKKVKVQSISLEEDAAKLISDDGTVRTYGLDRLGTPLVEVALEPVTGTPEEIMHVALKLGRLMRASKRVARGLGTIRQDVNISISGGGVIEVKGVQKLDQLVKVIEYEMLRQYGMLLITKKLAERNLKTDGIGDLVIDVTDIFRDSASKVIKKALENNGIVRAVRFKGFTGMLSYEPYQGIRLGKELGELVRFYGLGGIFHSDELPAYGINDSDVNAVREALSLDDGDAFVILAGSRENVEAGVNAIIERAKYALVGVPAETRAPTADGKTVYSRPRPGAARMYPETDIPPIPIIKQKLESLKDLVPKAWDAVIGELSAKYGINKIQAEKIFDSEHLELFEEIVANTKVPPTFVASTLTESLVNMQRQGLDTNTLPSTVIKNVFMTIDKGTIAKESVVPIFETIIKKEANVLDEAIQKLGLKTMSDEELEQILEKIVQENKQIIAEKGDGSISILMGKAMNILRGKVDGQKVNAVLKRKIESVFKV